MSDLAETSPIFNLYTAITQLRIV